MGIVGDLIRKAETHSRYRQRLDRLLDDDQIRSTLLHRIGARAIHDDAGLADAMPADLAEFGHLEDLTWLFTPNYANRGVSQLMFDEAGWLFRTIRNMGQPAVAEVGRAKGGTTFLMAAAGAHVVSVDDDSFEKGRDRRQGTGSGFRASVQTALDRAGLADRVELVPDDAVTHVVEPGRFDLVYLDIPFPEQRMQQLFDHWWPGVKPGGMLVVRDGTEPRVPGEMALAAKLSTRNDVALMDGAPGRFVVATRTA